MQIYANTFDKHVYIICNHPPPTRPKKNHNKTIKDKYQNTLNEYICFIMLMILSVDKLYRNYP